MDKTLNDLRALLAPMVQGEVRADRGGPLNSGRCLTHVGRAPALASTVQGAGPVRAVPMPGSTRYLPILSVIIATVRKTAWRCGAQSIAEETKKTLV